MQNQKTAPQLPQGARIYFPGHFPSGKAPYVTLGPVRRPTPPQRWLIPRWICDLLWALLFGPDQTKQSTDRRR